MTSREEYNAKPFYKRSPWYELIFLLVVIVFSGVLYWMGVPAPGKCKVGYTAIIKDSYKMQGFIYGYGRTYNIELKECVKDER